MARLPKEAGPYVAVMGDYQHDNGRTNIDILADHLDMGTLRGGTLGVAKHPFFQIERTGLPPLCYKIGNGCAVSVGNQPFNDKNLSEPLNAALQVAIARRRRVA